MSSLFRDAIEQAIRRVAHDDLGFDQVEVELASLHLSDTLLALPEIEWLRTYVRKGTADRLATNSLADYLEAVGCPPSLIGWILS